MIRKIFALTLSLGMSLGALVSISNGQEKTAVVTAAVIKTSPANELSGQLPESDAVILVDVQKVLTDFLPRLFAGRQAKLDQLNAHLDALKKKTGIDARMFQNVAVGIQYVPGPAKQTAVKNVVLARGTFNAGALVAAARIAANGRVRDVKYKGKTITVVTLDELKDKAVTVTGSAPTTGPDKGNVAKVLGQIINDQSGELALFALDQNTLAFGDLVRVQATIDAAQTPAANSAVIDLARRVPDSILSLGGNAPPDLSKQLDLGGSPFATSLNSIRQFFGAVSFNADSYNMLMGARATNAASASDLKDTLDGLQLLAGIGVGQIRDDSTRKIAQRGLDNVKVAQTGNEVQLQLAVPQADASALLDLWK